MEEESQKIVFHIDSSLFETEFRSVAKRYEQVNLFSKENRFYKEFGSKRLKRDPYQNNPKPKKYKVSTKEL